MRRLTALMVALVAAVALGTVTSLAGASSQRPDASLLASSARFACYPAQFGVFRPQARVVADQFSRGASLSISAPDTICAPAPGSSTSYLTCYRVTNPTRFVARTLRVVDEFARTALAVRVYRLATLCAPSARVDVGGSNSPARGQDLFTCYVPKASRAQSYDDIAVEDEFGRSDDALVGPSRVCSPAARKGSKPFDRLAFLTCYAAESETKGETVVVRNELGFLKAALGPRGSVCTAARLSS